MQKFSDIGIAVRTDGPGKNHRGPARFKGQLLLDPQSGSYYQALEAGRNAQWRQVALQTIDEITDNVIEYGAALDARITALESQPAGTPVATVVGFWQCNPQAGTTPSGMQFTCDNGLFNVDTTWIEFYERDQQNFDLTTALLNASTLFLQQRDNSDTWVRFHTDGVGSDLGETVRVPVVFDSAHGPLDSAVWQTTAVVIGIPTTT